MNNITEQVGKVFIHDHNQKENIIWYGSCTAICMAFYKVIKTQLVLIESMIVEVFKSILLSQI